ncbi:TetR/AcrR family transcriptional regulator [Paludisphaera mucosa]|uniref:TetR/AcrR family transcriptional regulator n=1 Tax=Paludisphaera mucosa TaxID=3030827 RepID=A0ABT6FKH0_9BACT|nr:TetR/AcrR family transcriptional regulator [Paludisphaera mucosa]MDG3008077.1 TetR/AcrR family transcriptional regulator [Paludisphaera mucosa]
MTERVDVGSIRRAQVVEAACRVIHRKGIQGASLAEIEQEAEVSRGVLTYHFPSKEAIILAVFDATIARMEAGADADLAAAKSGWERLETVLDFVLNRKPANDEFDYLNYTFLAQMSHREDFRTRLAAVNADIRRRIAEDLSEEAGRAGLGPGEVRALAAVVHAAMSGLIMQLNVDPGAIDRAAAHRALRAMILGILGRDGAEPRGAGRPRARRRVEKPGG